MTKDKRKNFRFKTERQKAMVFAYIRELKGKDLMHKTIAEIIRKEFNLKVHNRTIEGWINKQSCRFNENWVKEQSLVDKWHKELEDKVEPRTPEEVQLEEMFELAKCRGIQI